MRDDILEIKIHDDLYLLIQYLYSSNSKLYGYSMLMKYNKENKDTILNYTIDYLEEALKFGDNAEDNTKILLKFESDILEYKGIAKVAFNVINSHKCRDRVILNVNKSFKGNKEVKYLKNKKMTISFSKS